jgi:hypothetical protein
MKHRTPVGVALRLARRSGGRACPLRPAPLGRVHSPTLPAQLTRRAEVVQPADHTESRIIASALPRTPTLDRDEADSLPARRRFPAKILERLNFDLESPLSGMIQTHIWHHATRSTLATLDRATPRESAARGRPAPPPRAPERAHLPRTTRRGPGVVRPRGPGAAGSRAFGAGPDRSR